MNHDCEASMFVNLAKNKTGINMSRLCRILQDEGAGSYVGPKFFKKLLERYRTDLRDNDTEEKLQDAYIKIKMSYPVKQLSLKSSNWGWQYYKTVLEARDSRCRSKILFNIRIRILFNLPLLSFNGEAI